MNSDAELRVTIGQAALEEWRSQLPLVRLPHELDWADDDTSSRSRLQSPKRLSSSRPPADADDASSVSPLVGLAAPTLLIPPFAAAALVTHDQAALRLRLSLIGPRSQVRVYLSVRNELVALFADLDAIELGERWFQLGLMSIEEASRELLSWILDEAEVPDRSSLELSAMRSPAQRVEVIARWVSRNAAWREADGRRDEAGDLLARLREDLDALVLARPGRGNVR